MIAKYFHSRWKVILLYFFIILTYLCISFLYPYDNGPILYASQILGGIGIVIFFLDYYAFQKNNLFNNDINFSMYKFKSFRM